MLLKEGQRMKKKKERGKTEMPTYRGKINGTTSIPASPPNSDSNSSYLTDVDPSEIEVLEVKDFEYQSDKEPPVLSLGGKKKRKRKRKKKKAQGSTNTTSPTENKTDKVQNITENPKKKNAMQTTSGGPQCRIAAQGLEQVQPNLETQNHPKKKTKTNAFNVDARDHQKPNASMVDQGKTRNESSLHEAKREASQDKLGRKRKIENIFEEAELCMEEAVPRKIDEVKKLLIKRKGGTTGGGNEKVKVNRKEKAKAKGKKKPDYEDLSFKKARVDVDTSLEETTEKGISSGLTDGAQKIAEKVDRTALPRDTKLPDIDPNKFIPVKTQKLRTAVPDFEDGGDSESNEDDEEQRMNLMEAFADDDIADEFRKEKDEAEEDSKPKTVDLRLPGWGSWGGIGINPNEKKRHRRNTLLLKFPGVPRKDQGRKHVIINDDPPAKFRKQQVDDLPSEFPSVAAYEASIRAPIGNTWVPEVAHKALIVPPVITKMGAVIQPLDESHLIKEDAEEEAQKKFNESIKAGKSRKKKLKPSSATIVGRK